MADLKSLMDEYIQGETKGMYGRALVYCPKFCESGYEVCEISDGSFISQANGDDIESYVEMWVEIEEYI